jgi:hypothetical protein
MALLQVESGERTEQQGLDKRLTISPCGWRIVTGEAILPVIALRK